MTVIRVEKTRDYTVLSNFHLRDKRLSLKAKGLLSVMLSVPPGWDFSIRGLAAISKEGVDAISSGLIELEEFGYVERQQKRDAKGRMSGYDYTVYEQPPRPQRIILPNSGNPDTACPRTEFPPTDIPAQSITKEVKADRANTEPIKDVKASVRHKRGAYKNVLLADEDLEKLKSEFPNDWPSRIERLSEYMACTGKSYKNHLAVIRSWARKDAKAAQEKSQKASPYQYDYKEADVL